MPSRLYVGATRFAIADEDEDVLGAGKGSLFGDQRGLGGIDCARVVGALAAVLIIGVQPLMPPLAFTKFFRRCLGAGFKVVAVSEVL